MGLTEEYPDRSLNEVECVRNQTSKEFCLNRLEVLLVGSRHLQSTSPLRKSSLPINCTDSRSVGIAYFQCTDLSVGKQVEVVLHGRESWIG